VASKSVRSPLANKPLQPTSDAGDLGSIERILSAARG
jgi:hypothetical protein